MAKGKVNGMKRKGKTGVKIKAMRFLLLLVCMLTIPYRTVLAKGQTATARITISHSFEALNGYTPSAGTEFRYKIYATDSVAPAPEGADKNGERILNFSGTGTQTQTVEIQFTHAGIYQYTVEPVITNRYENYSYDETKYTVNVYVLNEGDGLNPIVVMYQAGNTDQKQDSILYQNSYTKPTSSTGSQRRYPTESPAESPATSKLIVTLLPSTGDTGNPVLWLVLIAGSLAAILVLSWRRKKEEKNH